ncbi:uncharacterized protein LOC120325723 isoform X2 [Styela clava]
MSGVTGKKMDILFQEFREALNKNIFDIQKGGVSLQFKDYLQEPEIEELPRLFEIGVDAFYRGEYVDEREYQPLPGFTTRRNIRHKMDGRIQITKDEIFNSLPPENLVLRSANKTKSQEFLHVMIVGPAGSGKTTILKRFARDACRGIVPQIQQKVVLIHWISCRSFSNEKKISVPEFLFRYMNHKPTDEAIKYGYEWMLRNSENVILILDSLDTLTYEVDDESQIIGPYECSSPGTILYNIFLGKILPKAQILSSSREYKIRNYKGELCADRIISLGGLTNDSIHNLVFGFLENNKAERVWNILHTQSLDLMSLCETPVFLAFTLVGLVQKGVDHSFVPNTMSGVMVNLLQSLLHSKHARALGRFSTEYVIAAINKMKKLSFQGTEQRKVLFKNEDLKKVHLTTEEITDLAIVVPGKTHEPFYQQILEGEAIAIFAHQVLQEVLTALSVAEMTEDNFKYFISEFIHQPYFSVIRRITCGTLLNEDVFEEASENLLQVTGDAKQLQKILTTSMAEELKHLNDLGMVDRLELFRAIHEAGMGAKSIVPSILAKISLMNTTLIMSDMYALASSIFYCECLMEFSIVNCKLTSDVLYGFSSRLEQSTLQIIELEIVGESNMEPDGLLTVGKIVQDRMVENLKLVLCELKSKEVEALSLGLETAPLKLLDISDNHHMGVEGLLTIGKVTDKCRLFSLILSGCKLNPVLLDALKNGLGNAKLNLLDVSRNKDMSEEGMKTLGGIIVKHKVKELGISGCRLKENEGIVLRDSIGNYKLENLLVKRRVEYFGYYDHHDDPQCYAVGRILPVVSKCVDMTGHDLKEVDQIFLRNKLDELYPEEPTIIFADEDNPTNLITKYRQSILQSSCIDEDSSVLASKSLQKEIGPKGGRINIGSCLLIFHEGSFDEVTLVSVVLEIDSSKWPEGYMCITAMLIVDAKNLRKPVTVRIGSWCKNDGTKKSKNSFVDVLHLADGESEWDVITRLPFNNDLVFQFECRDFSPVIIGRPEESLGLECFVIESYIFANAQNNFSLAFCLSDEMMEDKLMKTMERRESKMKINFSPISVQESDKLKTILVCQRPDGFSFNCCYDITTSCQFSFKIDSNFLRLKKWKMFNFFIIGTRNESRRIHLKCDIYKNDVIEEEDQCFQYDWRPENSSDNSQLPQQLIRLGSVTASSAQSNIRLQELSQAAKTASGVEVASGGATESTSNTPTTVYLQPITFNIENKNNYTATNLANNGAHIEYTSSGGLSIAAGAPESTSSALEAASSAISDSNLKQLSPSGNVSTHDEQSEANQKTEDETSSIKREETEVINEP